MKRTTAKIIRILSWGILASFSAISVLFVTNQYHNNDGSFIMKVNADVPAAPEPPERSGDDDDGDGDDGYASF
jgi:hypothetical protein